MKHNHLAGLGLLALACAATTAAHAQDRAMFARQPTPRATNRAFAAPAMPFWTYNWSNAGQTGSELFVGTDPASGTSSTIPVVLIPVKMTSGKTVEDPLAKDASGRSVISNVVASPIFQSGIDYVQGGVDLGKTQYIDAFQRASLWNIGASQPGYHVLLAQPTIAPEQTFAVPSSQGGVSVHGGVKVVTASITWFDNKVLALLASGKIPANTLPIFITSNTYLTEVLKYGCCIGGYHSYNGTMAYSHATYITTPGSFAQDVSALSHEIGEWIQDPLTNNSGCGGLWETGDPLEGEANYGGYPYALGGFTYNLQDLVLPPYFGPAASTSVNGYSTFQGMPLTVCQNGQ